MTLDKDCVFCKIVKGELPSYKVYEDEKYLAFLDIHPILAGHTLVIPKEHSQDLLHTSPAERDGLLEVVAKIAPTIVKEVNATAFNIGINIGRDSGQVVFHTHVHIIPRRHDDGMMNWKHQTVNEAEFPRIAERIRKGL
jgi:histidine triad (HIT) family protein